MELKRDKIFELMKKYCAGNYNRFARELKIDPSHLYRFLNTGVGGGKKIVGALMRFCKEKNLEFEEYVDI
jgi:hypothetical protein